MNLTRTGILVEWITMVASSPVRDTLINIAQDFLLALHAQKTEHMWDKLITAESRDFMSLASVPQVAHKTGQIDYFLTLPPDQIGSLGRSQLFSLIMKEDYGEVRTALLLGFASPEGRYGQGGFKADSPCRVVVEGKTAIVVGDNPGGLVIVPLLEEQDGVYRVDFIAMAVFSMSFTPSTLFHFGHRALELNDYETALAYLSAVTNLASAFIRIDVWLENQSILDFKVTQLRQQELQEQRRYLQLAERSLRDLLEEPLDRVINLPSLDTNRFLSAVFRGYDLIADIEVSREELERLQTLDDPALSKVLVKLLVNVDSVKAKREARKGHSGYEIADIIVPVRFEGLEYFLCIPIKSGVELKGKTSVPINFSHQVILPIAEYGRERTIVVLVAAKPCSALLAHLIRLLRVRYGMLIEVIEGEQLVALLKVNGLMPDEVAA